jgi:hypothetical protein
VQAASSDRRAENTYEDAEAILHEAAQIQAHLEAQDKVLSDLIAQMLQVVRAEHPVSVQGPIAPAGGAAT